jgi:uncharacterized membrane protein YcjF (UPF0283 family)
MDSLLNWLNLALAAVTIILFFAAICSWLFNHNRFYRLKKKLVFQRKSKKAVTENIQETVFNLNGYFATNELEFFCEKSCGELTFYASKEELKEVQKKFDD